MLSEVESVKCVSCGKSDVNKLGDVEEMIRCATCSRSGPPFSSHHPLLPADVDYVFIFFFLKLLAYVFGRIVDAAVDIKQNIAKPPCGTASVEICLLLSRRWSHRGNIGELSTF